MREIKYKLIQMYPNCGYLLGEERTFYYENGVIDNEEELLEIQKYPKCWHFMPPVEEAVEQPAVVEEYMIAHYATHRNSYNMFMACMPGKQDVAKARLYEQIHLKLPGLDIADIYFILVDSLEKAKDYMLKTEKLFSFQEVSIILNLNNTMAEKLHYFKNKIEEVRNAD